MGTLTHDASQPASIAELAGACMGSLGVLAADGPSLADALEPLGDAEARDRLVLACTASALRALLAAGIAPDAIVLGLDEPDLEAVLGDLPERRLRSATLVAPAVLEARVRRWWQGPLRLSGDGAIGTSTLGSLGTGRAEERAHRLLRHLGCDPVALVGVDPLGSDGVWHARGTALDSLWSAQLNPFLTLPTLEWRLGTARRDQHDAAMRRVRAFVSADVDSGLRVLDSLGGTIPEAEEMPLREVLRRHAVVRQPMPLPRRARSVALEGAPGSAPTVAAGGGSTMPAFIVAEPTRGGTGVPRHLDSEFGGRPVLARTIERVASARCVDRVVVVAPEGSGLAAIVASARPRAEGALELVELPGPLHVPTHRAVEVSRLWADSMWGGGIGGTTVFDEMLAPRALLTAMERIGSAGGLVVGGDWPLVLVEGDGGIESVASRFDALGRRGVVFGDAPPGLSPVCIGRDAAAFLAEGGAGATIGAMAGLRGRWAYDLRGAPGWVVRAPFAARIATVRAIFDSPRAKIRMRRGLEPILPPTGGPRPGWEEIIPALERQYSVLPSFSPQHLMLELCTGRFGSGTASPHRYGTIQREPMTRALLERILAQIGDARDVVVTFGGLGDPMRHPELPQFVAMARAAGARAIHVRTELLAPAHAIEALLEAGVDVLSVDIHAASRETYRVTMGVDRYEDCMANVRRVIQMRRAPEGADPDLFGLPFVVPRMQRRADTVADVAAFAAEWSVLGTALLEPPMLAVVDGEPVTRRDRLADASTPARTQRRELWRRMKVLSNGAVPVSECDILGQTAVATVADHSLLEAWRDVVARRRQIRREHGPQALELRTRSP
jgi:hypothetical protein